MSVKTQAHDGALEQEIMAELAKTNSERGQGCTFNSDLSVWDTTEGGYIATITMENVDTATVRDLKAFKAQYQDVINANPEQVKIGVFNLVEADGVDIDLNVRVQDKETALEIGRRFNQESVFDADNFECIETGGRGAAKELSNNDIKAILNEYLN